jgi:hypothetical protein
MNIVNEIKKNENIDLYYDLYEEIKNYDRHVAVFLNTERDVEDIRMSDLITVSFNDCDIDNDGVLIKRTNENIYTDFKDLIEENGVDDLKKELGEDEATEYFRDNYSDSDYKSEIIDLMEKRLNYLTEQ